MRSCLQINLHPFDVRHAIHTLEHQLRQFGGQVDRVVLTIDTKKSSSGRYGGSAFEESRSQLFNFVAALRSRWGVVDVVEVDYSPQALDATRRRFFGKSDNYPERAFDGGPFHAYFYGLLEANTRYVLHMDSDMLFGGGSQDWVAEAIDLLEANGDALFVGPLPGPPRSDGALLDRHRAFPGLSGLKAPERLTMEYPAYRFASVSTRIFLVDLLRFDKLIGSLDLVKPDTRRRMRARAFGQSSMSMPAEEVITAAMMRHQVSRIDFLGNGPGMYSLHPPFRTDSFYQELPRLIARILADDVPATQRGDYDINSGFFDWSDAIRKKRLDRRLARALLSAGRRWYATRVAAQEFGR